MQILFPGDTDISAISSLLDRPLAIEDFKPLLSSGLTHEHILIGDTGWVLRLPRKNQLGLSPEEYLEQQKSCYDLAEKSGATPACYGTIPPSEDLPNGALIVQYIKGRRVNSENDLPAVARALAALSSIKPAPDSTLPPATAPFATQKFVIHDLFGQYFDSQAINPDVREMLKQEKAAFEDEIAALQDKDIPMGLIGGDSHLANYLIDEKGKAWFVDLEFLTFDVPAIDVADASSDLTLRLDRGNTFSISTAARTDFYKTWLENVPDKAEQEKLIALSEKAVALRTISWMCYWQDSGRNENTSASQESRDNWDKLCAETLTVKKIKEIFPPKTGQAPDRRPQDPRPQ